jgi:hypothetical protein
MVTSLLWIIEYKIIFIRSKVMMSSLCFIEYKIIFIITRMLTTPGARKVTYVRAQAKAQSAARASTKSLRSYHESEQRCLAPRARVGKYSLSIQEYRYKI